MVGAIYRRRLFGRLAWRADSRATMPGTWCICSCSALHLFVCRAVRVGTLGRGRGSWFLVAAVLCASFGTSASMSPVADRCGSIRGKPRRRLGIAAWCFPFCRVLRCATRCEPAAGRERGQPPAGKLQPSNYYYTRLEGICQEAARTLGRHLPHRNGHPHEQDNQNGEQNCEAPHASSS